MARRHWEFDLEDGHHVVDLDHGYWSARRKITVDGVTTVQQGIPGFDGSGEYRIPLGARDVRIRIGTNGFQYAYDLLVDGRSVGAVSGARPSRPIFGGPGAQRVTGAVFTILAVPLLAFTVKGAYDEYLYNTASSTARGIVQEKRIISGRYSDSYQLTYVFADEGGALHTGKGFVSLAVYREARPGSRYEIQYLPGDPSMNRVLGEDDVLPISGLLGIGTFVFAMGVFLLVTGHRGLLVMKRVRETGQQLTATVTKLSRTNVRGVGSAVTIEYEYDDPYGRRRRGRGPLMYPGEAALYAVGGPVRVLIDPDRPGDSTIP